MDKSLHVLQIEDSEEDAALIVRALRRGHYDLLATRVDTQGAMNAALCKPWDLVLADWSLPQFSALAALEMLKRQGFDLPFIIVSGKISEEAAVAAMKAGAHDYVMKDNLSRLVPAIERELREAQARGEHRRAEAERRVLEERLRLVALATNDAVWDWDLTTNALWWNQTLFGYQAHEIELGLESWCSRLHPEERERVIAGRHAAINGEGTSWSDEYRFRRGDGSYAYVLDRRYVVRDEQGGPIRMIGAMMDISDRKRAEQLLMKSKEQLRQAFEERELLSQDLHDNIIQTLYAISLSLESCQHLVKEDVNAVSEKLEQAITRLNNDVIRDVRRYIEGNVPSALSPHQLGTELERLAHTSTVESFACRLRLDPAALNRLTQEEATQTLLIAREAVSNSVRHSRASTGTLALEVTSGGLRLTIEDDGVGFVPSAQDGQGHGLLNMAARAQKIGARLQVLSQPGRGTRIRVDIPNEVSHGVE